MTSLGITLCGNSIVRIDKIWKRIFSEDEPYILHKHVILIKNVAHADEVDTAHFPKKLVFKFCQCAQSISGIKLERSIPKKKG